MRSLFLPLFAMLALSLSCNEEDDSPPLNVAGMWRATEAEQYDCPGAPKNTAYWTTCGNFEYCVTIDFWPKSTYVITRTSDYALVGVGTYTISGNTLSMDDGSQPMVYQVRISGSKMTMTYNWSVTGCMKKVTYQKI